MSDTPKRPFDQIIIETDLARRQQAIAAISQGDIEERQQNRLHKDLLTELAIARWMLENPARDADRDTLELTREDVAYTKALLNDFEAAGYQYPKPPDQT